MSDWDNVYLKHGIIPGKMEAHVSECEIIFLMEIGRLVMLKRFIAYSLYAFVCSFKLVTELLHINLKIIWASRLMYLSVTSNFQLSYYSLVW